MFLKFPFRELVPSRLTFLTDTWSHRYSELLLCVSYVYEHDLIALSPLSDRLPERGPIRRAMGTYSIYPVLSSSRARIQTVLSPSLG